MKSSSQQELLPQTGNGGHPIYDQEFFLALARRGKNAWNRWREENGRMEGKQYVSANFEGVDFRQRENEEIDFMDFVFGDGANFHACQFGDGYNRERRADSGFVPGMARFSGATFGSGVNFSGAVFGNLANFTQAQFGGRANFSCSTFAGVGQFFNASFGSMVNFSNAEIMGSGIFLGVIFEDEVDFSGTTFGDAIFVRALFRGIVNLRGRSVDEWKLVRKNALDASETIKKWSQEQQQQFVAVDESLIKFGSGPNLLPNADFSGARCQDIADFSNRTFVRHCSFFGAQLRQPPNFDGCEGMHRVDFYGAKFRLSDPLRLDSFLFWRNTLQIKVLRLKRDSDLIFRLRELRKLAEAAKDHDLERDLYIEERNVEFRLTPAIERDSARLMYIMTRPNRNTLYTFIYWSVAVNLSAAKFALDLVRALVWKTVMFLYWLLADYGRSLMRPIAALFASIILFHAAYILVLSPRSPSSFVANATSALMQTASWPNEADSRFIRSARAFAIANALPFVGALTLDKEVKEILICSGSSSGEKGTSEKGLGLCTPIPSLSFQFVALFQSIFSALCIFFVVLALRNFFKLR